MAELKCKYCSRPIGSFAKASLAVCGEVGSTAGRASSGTCGNVALYPGLTDVRMINLFNKAIYLRQHMKFEDAAETLDHMISRRVNDVAVYFERALCNYGVIYSLEESIDAEHIICRRINTIPIREDAHFNLALRRARGEVRRYIEAMANSIDNHQKQMQVCADITMPKQIALCYPTVKSGALKAQVEAVRQMLTDRKFSIMRSRGADIETEIAHLYRAANTAKTFIIVSDSPESLTLTENYDCFKRFMARAAKDKSLHLAIICNNYDSELVPKEFFDFITVESHFDTPEELFEEVKRILFRISYSADEIPERAPNDFEAVFNYIEAGLFRVAKMYAKQFVKSHEGTYPYYLARLLIEYRVRNIAALAEQGAIITAGKYYPLAYKAASEEERAQLDRYAKANLRYCKLLYTELCGEYKKYTTHAELSNAAERFKAFGGIGDSASLAEECSRLALNAPRISVHDEYFVKYEQNNSSAETVEIPETVTCIRHDAFSSATNLKHIVIPEGVTAIEARAFYGCSSLKSVVLPSTLREIGASAFAGCVSLSAPKLPESLLTIGAEAFHGCSSITDIVLPKSLVRVGRGAFGGCASLSSLTSWFIGESPARNNYLGYVFGAERFVQNGSELPRSLSTFILRGNHSEIPESAFYNCKRLKRIEIPNSVTYIAKNAFFSCLDLEILPLPTSLREISEYAFGNCKSVTSATLPASVEQVAEHAFHGCDSLREIVIPSAVERLERGCLASCGSLESITLSFIGETESERCFLGHLFGATSPEANKDFVPDSLSSVILTPRLTAIPERALAGCRSLKRVSIPSDVTVIGERAFCGCVSLEDMALPSATVSIGASAFADCRSLKDPELPNLLKTIGERAFYGCSAIKAMSIPDGVERIGAAALGGCSALSELSLSFIGESRSESRFLGYIFGAPTAAQNGAYVSGNLERVRLSGDAVDITDSAFLGCRSLRTVELPASVSRLGNSAFSGCTSLAALPLGDGITVIGDTCFEGCRSITELALPASLERIPDAAFKGCTGLVDLVVPDTVRLIGASAFADCSSVASVSLPESLEALGAHAFDGCAALDSLSVPAGVSSIGEGLLCGASGICSVTLPFLSETPEDDGFACRLFGGKDATDNKRLMPSSLRDINLTGESCRLAPAAFADSDTLVSVTLPESLDALPDSAFARCRALESVTLPDALCHIGDRAFDSCRALGELRLPAALSEIGRSAFSGCKGITLRYQGNEEKWRELSASVVLPKNTSVTFETAE